MVGQTSVVHHHKKHTQHNKVIRHKKETQSPQPAPSQSPLAALRDAYIPKSCYETTGGDNEKVDQALADGSLALVKDVMSFIPVVNFA